jgi:hypothetical protein
MLYYCPEMPDLRCDRRVDDIWHQRARVYIIHTSTGTSSCLPIYVIYRRATLRIGSDVHGNSSRINGSHMAEQQHTKRQCLWDMVPDDLPACRLDEFNKATRIRQEEIRTELKQLEIDRYNNLTCSEKGSVLAEMMIIMDNSGTTWDGYFPTEGEMQDYAIKTVGELGLPRGLRMEEFCLAAKATMAKAPYLWECEDCEGDDMMLFHESVDEYSGWGMDHLESEIASAC